MAGLFDYQDPESVGRMMFAAGLLNAAGPSRMPVSTGQALSQGLIGRQQGAAEAAQNQRRNMLTDAQIQKMRSDAEFRKMMLAKGINPDTPAAIQIYEYWKKLPTDRDREEFTATQRAAQIVEFNGVKHKMVAPGQFVPLTDLDTESTAQATLAGAKQRAQEYEKARYDLAPAYNRQSGRLENVPRINQLPSDRALSPYAPRLNAMPQNAPTLSGRPAQQAIRGGLATEAASGDRTSAQILEAMDGPRPVQTAVPTPQYEHPDQQKEDDKRRFKIHAMENSIAATRTALQSLEKAADNVDLLSAGFIGGVTRAIPGTPGYNLKEQILPAQAITALEGLKNMRFESPTGAAVGNVALGELNIFMNKWGSLDTGQKPKQLKESIKSVTDQYKKFITMYEAAIKAEQEYMSGGVTPQAGVPDDPLGIRKKKP